MNLDNEEKELWNNYNMVSAKHQEALDLNKILERELTIFQDKIFSLQNDNEFMKKLILHANENY